LVWVSKRKDFVYSVHCCLKRKYTTRLRS
jgi:hypothetical protein